MTHFTVSSTGLAAQVGVTVTPPLVEMRAITKWFPGVLANDRVSFDIRRGEIHTLLGENGAGKSTLMNILSGMLQPDSGHILIDGRVIRLESPQLAMKKGIGMVYQHFTLVPNLSVIENVILGLDYGFVLDMDRAERRLKEMLGDFGLAVSPRVEVGHRPINQQQRVEIIKALLRGSRVLLLDEPTSVLTPPEARELFQILLQLKARGVAVVFITHKLDEALAVSDRVTILRQGRQVGELSPAELARYDKAALSQRIIDTMFGGRPPLESPARPDRVHASTRTVCALRDVAALNDRGVVAVRDITLSLSAGEIFGIAGVDGNGQKELGEVIAGQRSLLKGRIVIDGVDVTNKGVAAAARAGVGYVTDDRLGEACLPSLNVAENTVLKVIHRPPFSRWTFMNRAAIETHARRLIKDFNVKAAGPGVPISTLSGGNIQKLLLARELALKPTVLVCNKPTQGLDVLTARFILRTLREEADRGMAVLLISSELDEILELSDRIGVMYNGQLLAIISRDRADPETIGRLMLGIKT